MRADDELLKDPNAALVVTFEIPGIGSWETIIKIKDMEQAGPSAQEYLTTIFTGDGTMEDAERRRILEAAVTDYPENPYLVSELALLLAQAEDEAQRDPKKALELARRAVELSDKRDVRARSALAAALQANGELEEAARLSEELAKEQPNNPDLQQRAYEFRKAADKAKE